MTVLPEPLTPTAQAGLDTALAVVRDNVAAFGGLFPDDTTRAGRYLLRPAAHGQPDGGNTGWTTGFWTGQRWLAWRLTGDDTLRAAAEADVEDFARRVFGGVDLATHDLGFLYVPSCVLAWRWTGNQRGRDAALAAADALMVRFLEPAGVFQAWGDLADPAQRGRTIIDSLMNMPLLYWASEETGRPGYAEAARRHATALRDRIVRPDGSTFHTYSWDPVNGEPLGGATAQGYRDDSCWARGQAWGIYGFCLNYRWTGDATFLAAARTLADYFVEHLPADRVPYWDLAFGDGSVQERDSSSAAIAAAGLYELAEALGDAEAAPAYVAAADARVDSRAAGYAPERGISDALLLHGVYNKPEGTGVDEGTLWGDYFYLEALARHVEPGAWPLW